jgi:hypothetical protein
MRLQRSSFSRLSKKDANASRDGIKRPPIAVGLVLLTSTIHLILGGADVRFIDNDKKM